MGKNALVTGAGKRGGRAIALALGKLGINVAVHYHTSKKGAESVVREIQNMGVRAHAFRADLERLAEVKRLARKVERQFGPIDILVNNASNFIRMPLGQIGEADWDRTLDTNLKAPFFLMQEIGKVMKKRGGVIINIVDWAIQKPYPHYLPYCISKAGLTLATTGIARVLSPRVKIYAIAPKVIRDFEQLGRAVARLILEGGKSGATYRIDGRRIVG